MNRETELSKEAIEAAREGLARELPGNVTVQTVDALCDMALRSLSALREGENVRYERRPELDKRFANGDDYAGDAYVRWVAVGHRPNDAALSGDAK